MNAPADPSQPADLAFEADAPSADAPRTDDGREGGGDAIAGAPQGERSGRRRNRRDRRRGDRSERGDDRGPRALPPNFEGPLPRHLQPAAPVEATEVFAQVL